MDTIQDLERTRGVADRLIDRLGPMLAAERVFGDPVERDGVTVVPVASYRAGGGGGAGQGKEEEKTGTGEGGGFGATAKPAGVYVITKAGVEWKPAIDVDHLATVAGLTLMALLFFRWRVLKARIRSGR